MSKFQPGDLVQVVIPELGELGWRTLVEPIVYVDLWGGKVPWPGYWLAHTTKGENVLVQDEHVIASSRPSKAVPVPRCRYGYDEGQLYLRCTKRENHSGDCG
jgi:hypothetical protein